MKNWTALKKTHKIAIITALAVTVAGGGTAAAFAYSSQQNGQPAQAAVLTSLAAEVDKKPDAKHVEKKATPKPVKKTPAPTATPMPTPAATPEPSAAPTPTAPPADTTLPEQPVAAPVDNTPAEQTYTAPVEETYTEPAPVEETPAEETYTPPAEPEPAPAAPAQPAPEPTPEPEPEEPYIVQGQIIDGLFDTTEEVQQYTMGLMEQGKWLENGWDGFWCEWVVYSDGTIKYTVDWY